MRRCPCLALLFLLLLPASSFGQAASPRPAVILLVLTFTGKTENSALRALIEDAIRVELEGRGIRASVSEAPAADPPAQDAAARDAGADFVLAGAYDLVDDGVAFTFEWYDVERAERTPAAAFQGPIDLSFDTRLSDEIGKVLEQRAARLAELVPPPAPEPAPEPQPAVVEEAAGTEPPAAALAAPAQEPVVAQPSVPAVAPGAADVPAASPRVTRLAFSASSAPFIPVFKASSYITAVGLTLEGAAEYRLLLGGGLLGLSVESGVHMMRAAKASVADVLVVPVVIGVAWRTLGTGLLEFHAGVGAGPAFLTFTPQGGNPVSGVVPYVNAEIGAGVTFLAHVGLTVSLGWVSIFVKDAIMAVSPSIALDVKL